MSESLRPELGKPQTKGREPLGQKTVGGGSGEGHRMGVCLSHRARAGRKGGGKCRDWGRELGEPDGHGGGQGSRNSGRRLGWGKCAHSHHLRKDGGKGRLLRPCLALPFLSREPLPGIPPLPPAGPAGDTAYTRIAVHTDTCSLSFCTVDAGLSSRPGHHCLSQGWGRCNWSRSHR